jgi:nucleotide-binding universal stress UspA family protein
MKPIQKILVPIDFSPHSAEAIQFAADLSRHYEAPMTLVHLFQPVAYAIPDGIMIFTPPQLSDMLSEFQKLLDAAKQDALAAGAVQVDTQLLQGVIHSEIVNVARQGAFDLIVMGTHGRTGIKHALIGSVAEKIVRTAPCPVLTVRLPDKQSAT